MIPKDVEDRLFAKQVEVVADGMCDALVLALFEMRREKPSEPWKARSVSCQRLLWLSKLSTLLGKCERWTAA